MLISEKSDENQNGSPLLYEDPSSGKFYKKSGELWVEVTPPDKHNELVN